MKSIKQSLIEIIGTKLYLTQNSIISHNSVHATVWSLDLILGFMAFANALRSGLTVSKKRQKKHVIHIYNAFKIWNFLLKD